MKKIAVLIPCYNESQTIAKVVADYREALPEADIYVYDNNSKDGTDEIARKAGAIVRYERRQGKGNVIRTMFRDIDADCYLMIDGDDTYPAENAREMVDQVLNQGVDMVIGDRLSSTYFTENKRPFHNTGNVLVRKLVNSFFGGNITDIMTGYRAFSRTFVKSFPIMSKGFEIETEMTIHALDKNLCLSSIPVGYRDRPEGSVSKLNTFSDGFKVLKTIGLLVKDYKPLPFFSAIAAILILIGLILTVYASNSLYSLFRVSNDYYVPSVFNEMGFPYCFCHHFTTYLVEKPDGYDRREAENWDTAPVTATTENKDVHVIMVMNEAFSDLTDWDGFTYTAENDPLAAYHALQNSGHAFSGHIVVPNFAAGTANTEFDVLTGMQTRFLGAGTTSAMRTVNRNLDSLHRVFRADGYATSYLHPGDNWFYNRENVLRWFGAEETLFVNEMTGLDYKGRWVTDVSLVEQIRNHFNASVAEGKPVFSYITTIQNHMSYTDDKYGAGYSYPPVETDLPLTDSTRAMLSVYVEGVRDADAMLALLADTFSSTEEPVVLVYFGDHLPYLGDNRVGYQELGSQAALAEDQAQNPFAAYDTPYLIWANDSAAQTLDWEKAVAALELPADHRISASFLGQVVLELTGRGDDSPWFSWLGQLRRELPVVQPGACLTADGDIVLQNELSDMQQQMVDQMRRWSYYKLMQKEIRS